MLIANCYMWFRYHIVKFFDVLIFHPWLPELNVWYKLLKQKKNKKPLRRYHYVTLYKVWYVSIYVQHALTTSKIIARSFNFQLLHYSMIHPLYKQTKVAINGMNVFHWCQIISLHLHLVYWRIEMDLY